jgi:hypothetical protein
MFWMAAAGRLSGLVIQPFRELGQEHVTPQRIERLKRTLPREQRRALLEDLPLAPAWMHRHFRALAEEPASTCSSSRCPPTSCETDKAH